MNYSVVILVQFKIKPHYYRFKNQLVECFNKQFTEYVCTPHGFLETKITKDQPFHHQNIHPIIKQIKMIDIHSLKGGIL